MAILPFSLRALFYCLIVSFFSCSQAKKIQAPPEVYQEKYQIQHIENAQIKFSEEHVQVIPGSSNIYELAIINGDVRFDEGLTTKITWRAPARVNHYRIDHNAIKNDVHLSKHCKCSDSGLNIINEGFLKMEVWGKDSIQLDIQLTYIGKETGKVYKLNRLIRFPNSEIKKQDFKAQSIHYEKKLIYNKKVISKSSGNIQLIEGKGHLLELSRQIGPSPETDMGYYERIYFTLPSFSENINITDGLFSKSPAYYGLLCRCINGGYNKISEGFLKAVSKKTGLWEFNIDAYAYGRHDSNKLKITESFKLEVDPSIISNQAILNTSNSDFKNHKNDPFELVSCKIENNRLICQVQYSGGCSGANFMLFYPEIQEENKINLFLRLNDKDHCRSIVNKSVEFDLSPLMEMSKKGHIELVINESFSLPFVIH